MFRLLNPFLTETPVCFEEVSEEKFTEHNVLYYDKDGFELTLLEQEFYYSSGYRRFMTNCLNHSCWQQPWMEISHNNFILDHALILHRCAFIDKAKEQLVKFLKKIPRLAYLLKCPVKWGLDLSLDFVDNNGNLTEVIHIEIDTKHYHEFLSQKEKLQTLVLSTDWEHFYKFLDQHRKKWDRLEGFDQNNWKARHLGFKKAESTLKAI